MVWQQGLVEFNDFFLLLIPSVVNFLVPAVFMHFAIPSGHPPGKEDQIRVRRGGKRIMVLLAATILTHLWINSAAFHLHPLAG